MGNKDDDPERKVVLTQDAERFAERMQIQLFETSAKENKNVEEVSTVVAYWFFTIIWRIFYNFIPALSKMLYNYFFYHGVNGERWSRFLQALHVTND